MKKKIDAVRLQRAIRAKLSERYARSHKAELDELRSICTPVEERRSAMKKLNAKEKQIIEEFKMKIQNKYPEEQVHVTLFGSRVRGEATKESDMDILVVIRSEDWKLGDRIRELGYQLEVQHDMVLSIQVMSQRHIERLKAIGSQFLQEVEREGIVV